MPDPWLLPLAEAAAATYAGGAPWYQNDAKTCQVYRSFVEHYPCYAFEGTRTFREWMVDFLAVEVPFFQHPRAGPVHFGFWADIQGAIDAIASDLGKAGYQPFLLCGHSKGGGEAVLAHLELKSQSRTPLATRCYEPPMVGTTELSAYLAGDDIAWTRTRNVHGSDIVTYVPDWPEWDHQGVLTGLVVPDTCGIALKHEIAAVLAAVKTSTGAQ